MVAMLAAGTWVLICFVVLVAVSLFGFLNLRGHLKKVTFPEDESR